VFPNTNLPVACYTNIEAAGMATQDVNEPRLQNSFPILAKSFDFVPQSGTPLRMTELLSEQYQMREVL
jgi:hypothetical protein